MRSRVILSCLFVFIVFHSCKPAPQEDKAMQDDGPGYFSIKQFIKDQWNIYHGQPFGLQKIAYLDGKTDTSFISAFQMDWGTIFNTFFETDISDKKFLDRYTFTSFADDATMTQNFYYEAKEKNLFTQKLQVSADDVSHKVRSIYIETAKNGKWSNFSQKLFYMPLKVISIQEFEWAKAGPQKELRVEYRFLQ